ncbi:DUF721 domain-containing protein [Candidatus Parcubacteria bacterium]|nr:DUF721 domain-containing protein [Patescibacteria group bacterium]MCG2693819.1 DUF721 domain-containing protein [Candidatus Parcubacteria bacterium]
MAFDKIENLVKNRMRERGYSRQIDAITVTKTTEDFFKSKFPSFCHKINPVSFKNGALKIASLSAPIASELKLHEKEIISCINTKLGKEVVERLIFVL